MSDQEDNIEARLSAYIDGLLDPGEREQIEQYLNRYPEHRQLIDQLMQERERLRDLPREGGAPEVAAHFQGQLERSVLLGDMQGGARGSGRSARRGRWNGAVFLALLLLAAGASVIAWIAIPPQRGRQISRAAPAALVAATMPTTAMSVSATKPVAQGDHPRATLIEARGLNALVVLISAADRVVAEARVEAFLHSHSLRYSAEDTEGLAGSIKPTTNPAEVSWAVSGMSPAQADELVQWLSLVPATQPATNPVSQFSLSDIKPAPLPTSTTQPASGPAQQVVIIFQKSVFR